MNLVAGRLGNVAIEIDTADTRYDLTGYAKALREDTGFIRGCEGVHPNLWVPKTYATRRYS